VTIKIYFITSTVKVLFDKRDEPDKFIMESTYAYIKHQGLLLRISKMSQTQIKRIPLR